jgi:glucose-1-phosphate cytidylyltransferase
VKVVILAGGSGNRLGGDTKVGPKPMVDVGDRPLLWHIMARYGAFGHEEFVIAAGHQGDQIKRYFADFSLTHHDVRIELGSGRVSRHDDTVSIEWVVDVIDTGHWTDTAGRIKRLRKYLENDTFMVTFGDAVSDIDLDALLDVHRSRAKLATVTVVHPPPRFGELRLEDDIVKEFSEKPIDAGWINGGFMVFEPEILDFIEGDDHALIPDLMATLTEKGELAAYTHEGFWQSVDSMRDKVLLEELWRQPTSPWMKGLRS